MYDKSTRNYVSATNICNHSKLTNLSDHLIHSHHVSGEKKKLYCEELVFQFYLCNQINLNNLYHNEIVHLSSFIITT